MKNKHKHIQLQTTSHAGGLLFTSTVEGGGGGGGAYQRGGLIRERELNRKGGLINSTKYTFGETLNSFHSSISRTHEKNDNFQFL